MYKSLAILLVACCAVGLVAARGLPEKEVKDGMRNAFNRGIEVFGGSVKDRKYDDVKIAQGEVSSKPFSHYSAGIKALGGGKAAIADQYRSHHYTPLAPQVIPAQHKISDKITPEEAAKLHVPHAPLQYTTDRLRVV